MKMVTRGESGSRGNIDVQLRQNVQIQTSYVFGLHISTAYINLKQ